MKKMLLALLGVLLVCRSYTQNIDEWRFVSSNSVETHPDNPLALQVKKATEALGAATSEKLKKLGIDSEKIVQTVNLLKQNIVTIKKEVDELDRVVQIPNGPVRQIERIIQAAEELKRVGSLLADSSIPGRAGSAFTLTRYANELILRIDELQAIPLLKPTRRLLLEFAKLFENILLLRDQTGRFGKILLPDSVEPLLKNGISDLMALAFNLQDIISGGKRLLGPERGKILTLIIANRKSVPQLVDQFSKFEREVVLKVTLFLKSLTNIARIVIPMVMLATDLRGAFQARIEERRKKTYTGIVGPAARIQEIKNIIGELRTDLIAFLQNVNIAVASMTDVIDTAVTTLVEGIDKSLQFKILKPRAHRGAIQLPPNARKLQQKVKELFETLLTSPAPNERDIIGLIGG